jgi:cytochrome bd-type quinol oxidase subunit 2
MTEPREPWWRAPQPLWEVAAANYAFGFCVWTGSNYGAAWAGGGPHSDDAAFPHGTFSYPHALIFAAIYTAILLGCWWWQRARRGRTAIFAVFYLVIFVVFSLGLAAIAGLLIAVTP